MIPSTQKAFLKTSIKIVGWREDSKTHAHTSMHIHTLDYIYIQHVNKTWHAQNLSLGSSSNSTQAWLVWMSPSQKPAHNIYY
jgi:hypothetical protein